MSVPRDPRAPSNRDDRPALRRSAAAPGRPCPESPSSARARTGCASRKSSCTATTVMAAA